MGHDERISKKNSVLHAVLLKPGCIKEKKKKKKTLGEAIRYSSPGLRLPESAWVWLSNSSVSPVHPDEPFSALLFRGCCIEDQLNNLWDTVQTEVTGALVQKAGSVKVVSVSLLLNLSFA